MRFAWFIAIKALFVCSYGCKYCSLMCVGYDDCDNCSRACFLSKCCIYGSLTCFLFFSFALTKSRGMGRGSLGLRVRLMANWPFVKRRLLDRGAASLSSKRSQERASKRPLTSRWTTRPFPSILCFC